MHTHRLRIRKIGAQSSTDANGVERWANKTDDGNVSHYLVLPMQVI